MCGITGYIGVKEELPIVLQNLKKLEYRGYDSAGVSFFEAAPRGGSGKLKTIKAVGKFQNLNRAVSGYSSVPGTASIAHTRWATHGSPRVANAHPPCDCDGEILLVHNGIIENHKMLKTELLRLGHRFHSQTDTETIAHLIEEIRKKNPEEKFINILEYALERETGANALAIGNANEPGVLYATRLGSPLVVGIGAGEYHIASDPTALAGRVKKVIYLKDRQLARLTSAAITITPTRPKIEKLTLSPESAKKGTFP